MNCFSVRLYPSLVFLLVPVDASVSAANNLFLYRRATGNLPGDVTRWRINVDQSGSAVELTVGLLLACKVLLLQFKRTSVCGSRRGDRQRERGD
jgi:hypothetical protein